MECLQIFDRGYKGTEMTKLIDALLAAAFAMTLAGAAAAGAPGNGASGNGSGANGLPGNGAPGNGASGNGSGNGASGNGASGNGVGGLPANGVPNSDGLANGLPNGNSNGIPGNSSGTKPKGLCARPEVCTETKAPKKKGTKGHHSPASAHSENKQKGVN
jgi:hypothetical protein